MYWRVPDVRASVDSITRRVSTTDWSVVVIEGAVDPEEEPERLTEGLEVAREAARWLRAPMKGKTWQQWTTMLVNDLLLYDAGAVEKVREENEQFLQELVVRRSDDFWPLGDEHGDVSEFEQRVNGKAVAFVPDDLIYFNLFPNTTTARGLPILEALLNEVIGILRYSERAMMTLDASEIPPGILFLTGVAGRAAEDTIQSFIKDKGNDHKMRVLHFPKPGAGTAEWVKLDHSPKEITMGEIADQIRRSIYRAFGVFPVEMGLTDGMPRASAQVQLDASASHLLRPILELLQEILTTQVLPLLIPEEWRGLVRFAFDFTRDLTPQEEKDLAEADRKLIDGGIASRNEVRARRGWAPKEDADILTTTGQVHPLGPPPTPDEPALDDDPPDPEDDDPEGEDPDDDDPDDDLPDSGDAAPGEVEESVGYEHQCDPGCSHHQRAPGSGDDLPSDWQPAGRFKGYRTLPLADLAAAVSRYQRTVTPIWREAQDDFLASLSAAYADEEISAGEAANLTADLGITLARLADRWEAETAEQYRAAVDLAWEFARDLTGVDPLGEAREIADAYQRRAMGYLLGDDGPLENVRNRIRAILAAVGRTRIAGRAASVAIPDDVEPGMDAEDLLTAAASSFQANEHRIANWSGKLVELANDEAAKQIAEAASSKETGEQEIWKVEWVSVGDTRMCGTCTDLGSRGFMLVRNLPTVPGGATECGGRDRCVLVYWRDAEVADGTAVLLGGGNTGEPL